MASRALREGVNRKVLYAAMLLHDVGKGRDEDHSVLGAQITRKVVPRLGLNKLVCVRLRLMTSQATDVR